MTQTSEQPVEVSFDNAGELLEANVVFSAPSYRFAPRAGERREAQLAFVRGDLNVLRSAALVAFNSAWRAFYEGVVADAQRVIAEAEGLPVTPKDDHLVHNLPMAWVETTTGKVHR